MQKTIFILLLISQFALAQSSFSGVIRDAETGEGLAGAEIVFSNGTAVIADGDGAFLIQSRSETSLSYQVSYVGYRQATGTLEANSGNAVDILLSPSPLKGREVLVLSTRAEAGESPATFSTLTREDLDVRYYAQDLPVLLSDLPSSSYYSESGNGIGYNYLSIRGFDQRRVSVMVNGIPQNDPEDHNVYYVNFPDFLSNVEDVQVQRGAGNAFYGPAAIGGSINIVTSGVSPEKGIKASGGLGSFGTRKYSLFLNSGLLKDKYVFSARASRIESDGYRDRSGVEFTGFFVSGARFGDRSSTRLNAYGGPIKDQLAFLGISKEAALDRSTRRTNPLSRDDERESFNQPHIELIHDYQISEKINFRNTVFGIRGAGFFDFDGSWASPGYLRLTPEFGFDLQTDPNNFGFTDDLLIRAYVDNKQAGWYPSLDYSSERLNLTVGSELRTHRSLHWGRIQKASGDLLPQATSGEFSGQNYIGDRRFYEYSGGKDILAPFANASWRLNERFLLQAGLHAVYQRYKLFDEAFIGTEFDYDYFFLNPRIGLNVTLTPEISSFVSFSRTNREPRLSRLYDAGESGGGAEPEFERNADGSFDFDRPFAKPEKLNDIEVGLSYRSDRTFGSVNLYYMDFRDEIIRNGQVDIFGQARTGNADRTLHSGIEFSGSYQVTPWLSAKGNLTVSENEIKEYDDFSSGTAVSLANTPIVGHPDLLFNSRLQFQNKYVVASVGMKHVGEQFVDLNPVKEGNNTVDSYTVFDAVLGSNFGQNGIFFQLHVQNLFDSLYITRGDGADNFFPAAERQVFLNMRVEL
ncbi:MAG: TonB-dependent receptor [Calditrichia bacterium]